MTKSPKRYAKAIALLKSWLADDSGYDEKTWPHLKRAIERNRPSERKRFSDTGATMKFLCKIRHRWKYTRETAVTSKTRRCRRCDKYQTWAWSVMKDRPCWR